MLALSAYNKEDLDYKQFPCNDMFPIVVQLFYLNLYVRLLTIYRSVQQMSVG
jgi:hypothetical protein